MIELYRAFPLDKLNGRNEVSWNQIPHEEGGFRWHRLRFYEGKCGIFARGVDQSAFYTSRIKGMQTTQAL